MAHFEQINTLPLKSKIRLACAGHTIQEVLDAVHSLSKEYKMMNRARILAEVAGRPSVDIRPGEINLKDL